MVSFDTGFFNDPKQKHFCEGIKTKYALYFVDVLSIFFLHFSFENLLKTFAS